eukprot:GHVP01018478.1.p1 GENE.GHVP01018478.1~~GHVP01018478.1.p1  ORF type:complete len:122 (+),score=20.71 GHVP01018478.1:324-689(+)
MKKNDCVLIGATVQAALYGVLYRTHLIEEQRSKQSFLVSLVSVSLPDYSARIGSFQFTLPKDGSKLLDPKLEIGEVFNWKNEENAMLLMSHILSEPLTPLHVTSPEIYSYYTAGEKTRTVE